MRVLVCDDEPDIRHLYRSAFEIEGAEVATAEDGDQGIELARRFDPDLIILDLRMPRRDGLSALPELIEACPGAHILVVSAHVTVDQFGVIRDLGASECFDKIDFLGRIPTVIAHYTAAA